MTGIVILIGFYLLIPAIILFLCHKVSVLKKIGAIVIAYVIGLIIGNCGILPQNIFEIQDLISSVSISLAIPLLLFSLNLRGWIKMAKSTFVSMMIAIFAVVIIVIIGHFIWKDDITNSWKVSGMLIGVYTGGTPNLAAIKTGLGIDPSVYILTHSYDLMLSALYLLVLITFGKTILRRFLPGFVSFDDKPVEDENLSRKNRSFISILNKKEIRHILMALLISVSIFVSGYGLGVLIKLLTGNDVITVTVILTITTLGILASLIPAINKMPKTFDLGMYLILIFSVVVASMADLSTFDLSSFHLFYYVCFAIFGSLCIHLLLSKLFKVDADTTIIISTALICSPPFVPVVAAALKNRQVIISGLTVGIIGYAIGNYLGVFIAYLLR